MNDLNVDLSNKVGPRTLLRGFLILETVAQSATGIGVSEIALITQLDKGTVSRTLASLRDLGYVHQRQTDRRYTLGSRSLWLAHQYSLNHEEIVDVARPHLRSLRDATNENVHLAVIDGISMTFIAQEEPDRSVQVRPAIGVHVPLEQTAMGRAVLSALSPEHRDEMLAQLNKAAELRGESLDLEGLTKDIEAAAERGWAAIDRRDDVTRIATSIFGAQGEPFAALTLSGPSYRVDPAIQKLSKNLLETAKAITNDLSR